MQDRGGEDEKLLAVDEDGGPAAVQPLEHMPAWRVLIVDDDEEVHQGTLFALRGEIILGRRLAFEHAYSAAEAIARLRQSQDFAVILLDVVMESSAAGVEVIRCIREDLRLVEPRIILRTGQPGYAPESDAIRLYDINDYRTKSELTHTRLLTSITAAIRAYEQICSLAHQRRGLQKIIDASAALYEKSAIDTFAEGVILQIGALLHMEPEGIVCIQARASSGGGRTERELCVIGATGSYREHLGRDIRGLANQKLREVVSGCLEARTNRFLPDCSALYICVNDSFEGAVFINTAAPLAVGDQQLLSVFCTNIAGGLRNVRLLEELRALAFQDAVSQLPNRAWFVGELDRRLRHLDLDDVVAMLDIDHFAEINDALGHQNGDLLLRAFGERLQAAFPGASVARVGSDNFAVAGNRKAVTSANIAALFAEPLSCQDADMVVSVTTGFVPLGEIGGSGSDALKAASIALKHAKVNTGRGRSEVYRRNMEEDVRQRLGIYRDLRRALQEGRLSVHYQPQTSLIDGDLVGVEALARWRCEDGSYLPPDRFIPVAESTGLILPLGEFVFAQACRQLAHWQSRGLPALRMAINVSLPQLKSERFLPFVDAVLHDTGIDPARIEIEITESMLMTDVEHIIRILTEIRSHGVSVAIDDFGTGFSSLSYLQRLPVDRLKVDRSFVREVGANPRGETIARMVVELGKMLDLSIIGEGIETEQQADILRAWGCHEGQGFLYSRALPGDELMAWLQRR